MLFKYRPCDNLLMQLPDLFSLTCEVKFKNKVL